MNSLKSMRILKLGTSVRATGLSKNEDGTIEWTPKSCVERKRSEFLENVYDKTLRRRMGERGGVGVNGADKGLLINKTGSLIFTTGTICKSITK